MNTDNTKTKLTVGFLLTSVASIGLRADVITHEAEDSFVLDISELIPGEPLRPVQAQVVTGADRAQYGSVGPVIPFPHIPVSAANLPDGRILTFSANERYTFPRGNEFTYAATYDPSTGAPPVEVNHVGHDMFCGSLVMLGDGRPYVMGGRNDAQSPFTSTFNWQNNTWESEANMNFGRWYPTSTHYSGNNVVVASGLGGENFVERGNPTGYTILTGIDWTPIANLAKNFPINYLAPNGKLFHAGPTENMHWVTISGNGALTPAGVSRPSSHSPHNTPSAMYRRGKLLVVGGYVSGGGAATDAAYTVDMNNQNNPVVQTVSSMIHKRTFGNGVMLPNGNFFIGGGNTSGLTFSDNGAVLECEEWNPDTNQWRPLADLSVPRGYHSVGLLLSDGRVFIGGGGLNGTASHNHPDGQIYTPYYLYDNNGNLKQRPQITSGGNALARGTNLTVNATGNIQRFTLTRLTAVSHSISTDCRFLEVPFTNLGNGQYQLQVETNPNVLTDGYWFLWALDANGTPSPSRTMKVGNTVYGGGGNNGGGNNGGGETTLEGITINANLGDWPNTYTLHNDPDDVTGANNKIDVRQLFTHLGDDHLFLFWLNDQPIELNDGWILYFDTDKNDTTGYQAWGVGAEYSLRNRTIYRYTGNGSNWSWTAEGTVPLHQHNQWMEAGVPLSLIGGDRDFEILFHGANSNSGGSGFDILPDDGSGIPIPSTEDPGNTGGGNGDTVLEGITINANLSDWPNTYDLYTDPNDIFGANNKIDIRQLFTHLGNQHLFLFWLNDQSIELNDGWNLYFDTDKNDNTGYQAWGVGAEYILRNQTVYRYTGNGTNWSWTAEGTVPLYHHNQWMEAGVPLSLIGGDRDFEVLFHGANSFSGGSGFDVLPDDGSGIPVPGTGVPVDTGGGGDTVLEGITINANLSDWPNTYDLHTDPNDIFGANNKIDVRQLFTHLGNQHLFLFWLNDQSIELNDGWNLYFDTDKNDNTGYQAWGVGAEYILRNRTVYRYTGNGTNWSWTAQGTVPLYHHNQWMEAGVPLSLIGGDRDFEILFHGANSFSGGSGFDVLPDDGSGISVPGTGPVDPDPVGPGLPIGLTNPVGGNYVANPGFENGFNNWGDWLDNSYSLSSNARSGNRSMAVGPTEGGSWQIIPNVNPGDNVTASAWAYRTNIFMDCSLGLYFDNAQGNQILSKTVPITSTNTYGWFSVSGIAPAGTTRARVWVWKTKQYDWLIVDDVAVTK